MFLFRRSSIISLSSCKSNYVGTLLAQQLIPTSRKCHRLHQTKIGDILTPTGGSSQVCESNHSITWQRTTQFFHWTWRSCYPNPDMGSHLRFEEWEFSKRTCWKKPIWKERRQHTLTVELNLLLCWCPQSTRLDSTNLLLRWSISKWRRYVYVWF